MRVAVYLDSARPKKRRVLAALAEGIAITGDQAVLVEDGTLAPRELPAVIYGVPYHFNGGFDERRGVISRRHKNLLIVDGGILPPMDGNPARGCARWWWGEGGMFRVGWFTEASVGGPCLEFRSEGAPADRWGQLGYEIAPWRRPEAGGPVLICPATETDHRWCSTSPAESGGPSAERWTGLAVAAAREFLPGVPIALRHHPRSESSFVPIDRDGQPIAFDIEASGGSIYDWLRVARVIVGALGTHLVEAALKGVPVIATNSWAEAWPIAGHRFADMADPPRPNRNAWAWGLAYSQWTIAELSKGEAWSRLRFRQMAVEAAA